MNNAVITDTKQCSGCGDTHPATKDYFGGNRSRPDGLDAYCKPCRRVANRKQYHRERNPQYYKVGDSQRQEFLDNVMAAYDRAHIRRVALNTRARYLKLRDVVKQTVKLIRVTDPPAARQLAAFYKTFNDVRPWIIEIHFPSDWRPLSAALRNPRSRSLYEYLRTHFEVVHGEEAIKK